MHINSIWCEITLENGTKVNTQVPFEVVAFKIVEFTHKPFDIRENELAKIKNWEPE